MQPEIASTTLNFGLRTIAILALPVALLVGLMCFPSIVTAQPAAAAPQQAGNQAQATVAQWRLISPSDAMAKFQMPKKPRYIERTFSPVANKPPIKVHLYLATVNEGKATYIFGYHDLHEVPADARTLDKALEGAVRGSVVNVQGKLLNNVTKIRYKNVPGRQFNYEYIQGKNSYVVLSRVYIVGKRQFQITALALKSEFDPALAADYLNSFRLVRVENDEPPVPRLNN